MAVEDNKGVEEGYVTPPMTPKRCREYGFEFRAPYMGTRTFLCGFGKEMPCSFQGKDCVNRFGETVYPCGFIGTVTPVKDTAAMSGNPLGLERSLSPSSLGSYVEGVLNGTPPSTTQQF